MKTNNIIALGLLGAGAFYLMGRKTLAGAIRFSIESFKVKGMKIELGIGILNPTNQSALLKSIVCDVLVKGNTVATIEFYNTVKIVPNGKTKITMLVTPKGLGIITTILTLTQKDGLKNLSASLIGTANIDNTALPVNVTFVQN